MKQTAMLLKSKQLAETINEESICYLILGTFPLGGTSLGTL